MELCKEPLTVDTSFLPAFFLLFVYRLSKRNNEFLQHFNHIRKRLSLISPFD